MRAHVLFDGVYRANFNISLRIERPEQEEPYFILHILHRYFKYLHIFKEYFGILWHILSIFFDFSKVRVM